jgi:hypothetical protein
MAEVQLEDFHAGGPTPNPETFNQATFNLEASGTPPQPWIDC